MTDRGVSKFAGLSLLGPHPGVKEQFKREQEKERRRVIGTCSHGICLVDECIKCTVEMERKLAAVIDENKKTGDAIRPHSKGKPKRRRGKRRHW